LAFHFVSFVSRTTNDADFSLVSFVSRTTNFVLKWMDGFWMDFQDHPRMIMMIEELMAKLTMSQLGILALRLRNVLTQKLYGKEVRIVDVRNAA
jgi:hypothetical protein